jgi:hypothetical protein
LVSEHGQRGEELAGVYAERRDAGAQGARDGRQREVGERARSGGRRLDAVLARGERQLAREERVAAGERVDGGGELVGRFALEHVGHERHDGVGLEAREAEPDGARVAANRVDQRRVGAVRRVVAARQHEGDSSDVVELQRQRGERAERLAIAALDVVDRDHHRPCGGKSGDQPHERVRIGARKLGVGRVARAPGGFAEAVQDAESRAAVGGQRARGEHERAALSSADARLLDQPTLSGPGRALDDEQNARAAVRRPERGRQPAQFFITCVQPRPPDVRVDP